MGAIDYSVRGDGGGWGGMSEERATQTIDEHYGICNALGAVADIKAIILIVMYRHILNVHNF